MELNELHNSLSSKLAELEKARAAQRAADNEVQRLKVELANLNVRMSLSESANADLLASAVNLALDAW
jgi:hypothetical protein